MKSTLPALFRIHSKQKPKQLQYSPEKQSEYYTLNLTISHNYRTKIINPHHQQSDMQPKIPGRFRNPSKTARYSDYPSRSLSVQHSYQPSQQPQLQTPSQHKKIMASCYTSKYNIQQFDSIRINIRKIKQQILILKKSIQTVPQLHQTYQTQLKQLQQKIINQNDKIQRQTKDSINSLWQMLSKLRRQTNIQIKTMKRDLDLIAIEVKQQIDLVKDIQQQRTIIKKLNF